MLDNWQKLVSLIQKVSCSTEKSYIYYTKQDEKSTFTCKIFFLLDLRSGYDHIGPTPEAKPKTASATTSRKWHWNVVPFRICSLPDVFAT